MDPSICKPAISPQWFLVGATVIASEIVASQLGLRSPAKSNLPVLRHISPEVTRLYVDLWPE